MGSNTNKKIKDLDIRNKNLKKIGVSIGSLILSTSFFTGCHLEKDQELVVNPDYTIEEEVDDSKYEDMEFDLGDKALLKTFDDGREIEGNIYSYSDINHLDSLILRVDDDFDYSFLNYANNLEYLEIYDYSSGNSLSNIDGSNFKNEIIIAINIDPEIGVCNEERYGFLREVPIINTLVLGTDGEEINVDYSFIDSLDNVIDIESGLDMDNKTKVKK